MKTYLVVSFLLNLIAAAVLTLGVLFAANRSSVRRCFLFFLSSITIWTLGYALWQLSSLESSAYFYCKILISAAVFIPVTFYHFALALSDRRPDLLLGFGYVLAGLTLLATPFGLVVSGVSARPGLLFWPDPGPLLGMVIVLFSFYVVLSASILFRGAKNHVGLRASQMKFVLASSFIGYVGGGTNFPFWYDIPIPPYGNMIVFIYLLMVGYGVYSNQMFSVSLDVYRAVIGLLLNGSVALCYVILAALYWAIFDVSVRAYDYWLNGVLAFFLSIVIFWGVPRLKFWTEGILEGVFRRERASALSELKDLPTKLSDLAEDESIFEMTAETVMRSLDVTGVAVFALEPFDSAYRCSVSTGEFSQLPEGCAIDADSPIVEALGRQPVCLVLDQIYGEIDKYYYQALVDLRNELQVSVIVPIFANHEVYGLLLLGPPKQPRAWSEEEVSILFNVGAQIGINFRTRDFERRASEVDKLVALGTMAAGLAHEIRNPLVSVQTFASMMQSGKSLDRVSEQFKGVLLRDVKRIASIVEGVALYSQNQKGKKAPISINTVLLNSIDIASKLAKEHGVAVRFATIDHLDATVFANLGQLVQVFSNLIENAIQALSGVEAAEIRVAVTPRKAHRGHGQSWVEVAVSDNGPGIPKAILSRIFDPFITSKDTGARDERMGMGLGLAISKRIIENHNGAITVVNAPEGGAEFLVSLKCMNSKDEEATR